MKLEEISHQIGRMALLAALALPLGVQGTPKHAAAKAQLSYEHVAGDPMNARIYTLDNGLKVYLTVNKETPRIQTYIAVRTGSRNDPAETTGLAHYLEHLMFKGTKQFGTTNAAAEAPYLDEIERMYEDYRVTKDPEERRMKYHKIDSVSQVAAQYNIPNEYDKLMAAIGSEGSNAYTSNDVTCYVEDIPANEVENWAKIQSDRFQNMVIRGFHTELEAVYEEYNMGLTSDIRKVWEALCKQLYPTHPYGTQTTIGTQEHLKNPSITNIKEYFKRYYCPNNVAICMSGDFDCDEVMAIIEKYFGDWKPNPTLSQPTYAPVRELTQPAETTVIGRESDMLYMAWKMDGAASWQCDTVQLISDMLSNGKAGLFDLDLEQPMKWLGGGAMLDQNADYSTFVVVGMPNQGQTLDELKGLILNEMEKLKRGDFSDDLLPSVVNNTKLALFRSMENNRERADMFVNSFINGESWESVVGRLDRMSHITKQQIVDFANRHFKDNYALVRKVQGVDTLERKIEKPAITPIPSNREYQSQFVTDVINSHAKPIEPVFVDYQRDMQKGQTKQKLPILYVQNKENDLFELRYHYDFGMEADNRLAPAADYLSYLGTSSMSAEQLKQAFYKIACEYSINVQASTVDIALSGLGENMNEALQLLESVLSDAKPDAAAWQKYVEQQLKARQDAKLNQKRNWRALVNYATYGPYNPTRNVMSANELQQTDPQTMVDLIKSLPSRAHTLLYYGPLAMNDLAKRMQKLHKTPKHLLPALVGKEYQEQATPQNEVVLAPYEAKNIYMEQLNNSQRQWDVSRQPTIELFNEYYGGGMNTVVFQELRETRGLAYSAAAYYYRPFRKGHPEYATTVIISQNDKMMDCVNTFKEILDNMPKSEKAFDLAKQSLKKRIATSRTTKMNIIDSYLDAQRMGLDYSMMKNIYEALPSLSLTDIANFEQQTMAQKPWKYIILGDEKNLDMQSLEKIGPIKRLTTEEIFGY